MFKVVCVVGMSLMNAGTTPHPILLRFFRKGSVAEKTEDSNSPLKTIDPFFIRFAGAPIFIRFSSVLLQRILCGSTVSARVPEPEQFQRYGQINVDEV